MLAVVLPIALHLFELRQPKRVAFTNVEFLREVKLVTARQRKVKHLLVLFTRIGLIGSLVLLFAQPFIPAPLTTILPNEAIRVVVDTTPSMQAGPADAQTAFEKGVEEARQLPTAYPTAARFQLLNSSRYSVSGTAFRSAVDQLQLTGSSRSVASALVQDGGTTNQQLFIFSDFQKNDYSREQLQNIDSATQVFLIPVAGASTHNIYVDSVWLDDAFIRSGTDMTLRIRLRNGGNMAAENTQVKLLLDNRQAAAFRVPVPANGQETVTARVQVTGTRAHLCRVEVEDYPVTFDNTFYFTLTPSPQIPVVDITSRDLPATQRLYSNEALFAYSHRVGGKATEGLAAAQLVLVQELPRIDPQLREQLKQVVQRGGSVVIVPSAAVEVQGSYAELFQELGVGPVTWEQPQAGRLPQRKEVALPNRQNTFFRDVFGAQQRQVTMPTVAPVVHWARSTTDILRLRDGEGYLSGFRSGRGMVYVFSAPFTGEYSNFTSHPLFVPVMYRLAMQSYKSTELPAYRLNQGLITIPGAAGSGDGEQVVKLVKDSLTLIPTQRSLAGDLRLEVPPGMREPGFYTLERAGRKIATLAFNVDKKESELAHYSAPELRQMWAGKPNIHVYEASEGTSIAARYRAERVGTPLWKYCVAVALLCLLAEVLLLRFGGTRSPAVAPVTAG
ncbi:hypothetical protein HER32_05155 [Hymenobacter sp. BT18]|nr:hypothetical protein HER32_05155 [Hymenobacter sp. BT18]